MEPTQPQMPKEKLNVNKILNDTQGETTRTFQEQVPQVMKELTAQLVKHRDIRVRERIRAQMKGLFAFILADTEYPEQTEPLDEAKKDRFDEVV